MNPICIDCPLNELCHAKSTWNEKGVVYDERLPISTVHTCGTCGKRKLTLWDESNGGPVPDDCPRWNAHQGCSLDCNDCLDERRLIKEAHPMSGQRHVAAKALLQGLLKGAKAKDAAIGEFVDSLMPTHVIKTSDKYEPALSLMGFIWAEITHRFDNPWKPLEPERVRQFRAEWLEYIYLSMQRNPTDPARVTWEIVLLVTDLGLIRSQWSQETPQERVKIQSSWEIQVRRVMGLKEPARC